MKAPFFYQFGVLMCIFIVLDLGYVAYIAVQGGEIPPCTSILGTFLYNLIAN